MPAKKGENKKDVAEDQVKEDIKTEYLFPSDMGDIPVNKEMMAKPFITRPMEIHPFLTLGDFFNGIRDFFLKDEGQRLIDLIQLACERRVRKHDIKRLIIRYEKYGTLYHILSIEVKVLKFKIKYALSATHFQEAKKRLESEFGIINGLHTDNRLPYIPRQFLKNSIAIGGDQNIERFLMTVSEWFDDYHEWHFSGNTENAKQAIIWDMDRGYRPLKTHEIKSVIYGASKILTLYHDIETRRSITQWHHGAGDFVIKISANHNVDVRLISVRGYESVTRDQKRMGQTVEALIDFLLHMTIKMRIDKNEGMGEPVWANAFILSSVLVGFFKGLEIKAEARELTWEFTKNVLAMLKGYSEDGLRLRFSKLVEHFSETNPADHQCVKKHLEEHTMELNLAIKDLHTD